MLATRQNELVARRRRPEFSIKSADNKVAINTVRHEHSFKPNHIPQNIHGNTRLAELITRTHTAMHIGTRHERTNRVANREKTTPAISLRCTNGHIPRTTMVESEVPHPTVYRIWLVSDQSQKETYPTHLRPRYPTIIMREIWPFMMACPTRAPTNHGPTREWYNVHCTDSILQDHTS